MALSQYERSRQDRIKQNLERLQSLGLRDLSSKVHSISSANRRASTGELKKKHKRPNPPSTPETSRRRSFRLQNTTPVSYSEKVKEKSKRSGSSRRSLKYREVGSRVEEYTAEDEKLLGNTKRSWDLFVDGCGKDGRRIYDSIKGKTCHQCRQKTLGMRTRCSSCDLVQGQICGDCLYMRYGEHVVEALENPDWVCPACRGICNCSFCRQAKGWAPTGSMYRQVVALGYKSVAHYLVQTRKVEKEEESPISSNGETMETPKDGASKEISNGGRKSVDISGKSTDENSVSGNDSKKRGMCIDIIEKSTEVKGELDTIGARLRQRRRTLSYVNVLISSS